MTESEDKIPKLPIDQGESEMKQNEIPTSALSRGSVTTTTVAKVGGKTLKFMIQKPFTKEENREEKKAQFDAEIGQMIFDGLSKLRGTALKIAQLLSLEMDLLPPHLREQLSRSQYQVPPLNRALVRKVVESEFKKPVEEVFATFEMQAFAAASLGQVHRATLPDGTPVAVKVQYPGIKDALASDLKMVKSFFLPLIKTKFPGKYLDKLLVEVTERLEEETNYEHEAKQGLWFADNVKTENIIIPRPLPAYSGKTVLTAEIIDGLHMQEWLESAPDQETINKASQAIFNFHTESMMGHYRIHADPNPGNYLFLADGTVAVIDFGCTKSFEASAMKSFADMMYATVADNKDDILKAYGPLGADTNHPKFKLYFEKCLYPFNKISAHPYKVGFFDFKQNPEFTRQMMAAMTAVMGATDILGDFTPETVFIDRTYYGVYRIFDSLGSVVNFHHPLLVPGVPK